jgi:two-component system, sensor histidine kinase and response regulator
VFRERRDNPVHCVYSWTTLELNGRDCVLVVGQDVTARVQAEEELRHHREVLLNQERLIAAREAAEAASRAKSEFLSSMSHDIRTPMNVVLGMAQLLAETDLSEYQRHYLEIMVANGNSLLDLINSILDLAKIESGRMQFENSEFDLTELIDKTISTLSVHAHSKGLELAARIAPGVPERLVGDPLRLRQILLNLLGNAIKFTELGDVVLEVDNVLHSHEVIELEFSVADSGIGIPPDKLDSIFSNFTQADSSTTRKYGGSGLGLAIAHRLVGMMGGRLSVQSELHKGSRFSFGTRFGLAPHNSSSPTAVDLTGYRVLIVDTNPINRQVAREMLAGCGAEIAEAWQGHESLIEIRRATGVDGPYQIVLLDMRMPVMDGFEALRRLQDEGHSLKRLIPMLSSDELKMQINRLQELGLGTYLVKPITQRALYDTILPLLEGIRSDAAKMGPVRSAPVHQMVAKRILVAEDSPDNRLVIAAFLCREPHQVDLAQDGNEAFERFIAHPYDLVLMDVQMPVMDGLDATRAIRQWELKHGRVPTPIVALTAYALEEDVRRALAAGCNLHMSKPLRKQALIECIGEATQQTANALNSVARPN